MNTAHILIALALSIALIACSNADVDTAKADAKAFSDKVAETTAALEKAQVQIEEASQQVREKTALLQDCITNQTVEQNKTKTLIKSLGEELAQAHADASACEERMKQAESDARVISDAARRLCCAQRVERPEIDSFSIEDEKIICKSKGDTALTC